MSTEKAAAAGRMPEGRAPPVIAASATVTTEKHMEEEAVFVDLPAPAGWKKKFMPKTSGTLRKNEIIFVSPTGEELRNKRQLDQYLKSHAGGPPSAEFDWGTGDAPRRSARISERNKALETMEEETPKKRARRSTTKKGSADKKDQIAPSEEKMDNVDAEKKDSERETGKQEEPAATKVADGDESNERTETEDGTKEINKGEDAKPADVGQVVLPVSGDGDNRAQTEKVAGEAEAEGSTTKKGPADKKDSTTNEKALEKIAPSDERKENVDAEMKGSEQETGKQEDPAATKAADGDESKERIETEDGTKEINKGEDAKPADLGQVVLPVSGDGEKRAETEKVAGEVEAEGGRKHEQDRREVVVDDVTSKHDEKVEEEKEYYEKTEKNSYTEKYSEGAGDGKVSVNKCTHQDEVAETVEAGAEHNDGDAKDLRSINREDATPQPKASPVGC